MNSHKPIYHRTGRNACGKRLPDRDEPVVKGFSMWHKDEVCVCGDKRRERERRELREALQRPSVRLHQLTDGRIWREYSR